MAYTCAFVSPFAPGWVVLGRTDGGVWLCHGNETVRFERVSTFSIAGVAAVPALDRLVVLDVSGQVAILRLSDAGLVAWHEPMVTDVESRATRSISIKVSAAPDSSGRVGYPASPPTPMLTTSAHGRRALASGRGGMVVDVETGELVSRVPCDELAALSPDGSLIATIGNGIHRECQVELVTADGGLPAGGMCKPNFERVRYAIAWHPNGQAVLVTGYEKVGVSINERETIWSASPGAEYLRELTTGPAEFRRLACSADGSFVAWATADDVVGITSQLPYDEAVLRSFDPAIVGLGFWSPERLLAVVT